MALLILTAVLLLCMVVLPGLGFPSCPLLVFAGGFLGHHYGMTAAVILAITAVTINILGAYWIAAYPLRDWLHARVQSKARRLLVMEQRNVFLTTLALHVTPGVPLCIQTYFPGVHRLPYWQYLGIALPVQSVYTALIVAGGSAATSSFLWFYHRAPLWPCLLLIAGLVWLLRRRRTSSDNSWLPTTDGLVPIRRI